MPIVSGMQKVYLIMAAQFAFLQATPPPPAMILQLFMYNRLSSPPLIDRFYPLLEGSYQTACTEEKMSIKQFSQTDPQWKATPLGFDKSSTIGGYGCLLTSMTMCATHYGAPDLTPAT